MPDIDKINGVDTGGISKVNGVAKASVDDFMLGDMPAESSSALAWYVGASSGKMFKANIPDNSGGASDDWAEMVSLNGAFTDVAIGQDASGNKRLIAQTKTASSEIHFGNTADDLTNASNWTTLNLNIDPWGNPKGADMGPALAYGNGVWMAAGLNGATGEDPQNYEGLTRSTDGGATWAKVDLNNTVNATWSALAYKGGTTDIWLLSIKDRIWTSSNAGTAWTDRGQIEADKQIHSLVYTPDRGASGRWCAALTGNNIYTSDDDGASWTERTAAVAGGHQMNSVVYAKGSINKFIMGGATGRLQRSDDGVTWTQIWAGDDSDWGTSIIYQIATDGTTIVVVGGGGKVATSTDGINFTVLSPAVSGVTMAFRCVCSDVEGGGLR